MARKKREIKNHFKVFCEGDTEFHYIDGMKRKKKFSIALKPVNMEGGGYSSFLKELKTDEHANCLAKFIIIDGDRAISEEGEKKKLRELLEYCKMQNSSKRIPHILIVNDPDFEYIGCLHTPDYKEQNVKQYIVKQMKYPNIDTFKANEKIYDVLNRNGNSIDVMLEVLKGKTCFVVNNYRINKRMFEIDVETSCNWENLGKKGSNINEFFEILGSF